MSKELQDMANDEANEGWKWAINHLKEKDPAIAYEHGVRAGYLAGYGATWIEEKFKE